MLYSGKKISVLGEITIKINKFLKNNISGHVKKKKEEEEEETSLKEAK